MSYLAAFLVSLGLAFFLKGTKENPSPYGGLAVLAGLLLGVWLQDGAAGFFTLRVFWLALGILFLMGVLDDFATLRPLTKMGIQIIAITVFLFFSSPATWTFLEPGWFMWGLPVLFLWLLGITNAVNLLDNMDGLTPGVAVVVGVGFWVLGLGSGSVLLALVAALAGFMVLNFPPAKIYLGDAGSHLVGFSLAALPLMGLPADRFWVPILVLLIPIIDTTFVTFSRLFRGVSPFQGGKDHISHHLFRRGLSERTVCLIFYLVTAILIWSAADLDAAF